MTNLKPVNLLNYCISCWCEHTPVLNDRGNAMSIACSDCITSVQDIMLYCTECKEEKPSTTLMHLHDYSNYACIDHYNKILGEKLIGITEIRYEGYRIYTNGDTTTHPHSPLTQYLFDYGVKLFNKEKHFGYKGTVKGADGLLYAEFWLFDQHGDTEFLPLPFKPALDSEWCSHCGNESDVVAEMKVQKCHHCKMPIVPCAICEDHKCNECPLDKQASELNKVLEARRILV